MQQNNFPCRNIFYLAPVSVSFENYFKIYIEDSNFITTFALHF